VNSVGFEEERTEDDAGGDEDEVPLDDLPPSNWSGRRERQIPLYLFLGRLRGRGPKICLCEANPAPPRVLISARNRYVVLSDAGRLTKCPPESRSGRHLLVSDELFGGNVRAVDLDRVEMALTATSPDSVVDRFPGVKVPWREDCRGCVRGSESEHRIVGTQP
jgi:hypothetical protein